MQTRLAAHAAAETAETVNLSSAGVTRRDASRRVKGVLLIHIIIIPVPKNSQSHVSHTDGLRCQALQLQGRKVDGT